MVPMIQRGTPAEEAARIANYAKVWGEQYARWLRACELEEPFGDNFGDHPECDVQLKV
jgi:hypothetical protein